jgi:hypothetical protein
MLGFRTAILGRIYHKFRFADHSPAISPLALVLSVEGARQVSLI